jgi:hypothetical protein
LQCVGPTVAGPQTKRVHDGFFARVALGVGYLTAGLPHGDRMYGPTAAGVKRDVALSGVAQLTEVSFGGKPAPGLVVGGGLFDANVFKTRKVIGDGYDVDESAGVSATALACPFVDYYPSPSRGLHFLGAPCVAVGVSEAVPLGAGWGLAGAVGYEAWIGDEWSLGVLGRAQWALLWASGEQDSRTVFTPAVLLAATYH